MEYFSPRMLGLLLVASFAANSQTHLLTVFGGTCTVQGEFAPGSGISPFWFPQAGCSYTLEPGSAPNWQFSVSWKYYTLEYIGSTQPESWKWGLDIRGQGILALVTARYILSSNTWYNRYGGMFLPYLEAGAGVHFTRIRGIHEAAEAHPFSRLGSYTFPGFHLGGGFQWMITDRLGIHLAASGQWTNSDKADGIDGSDTKKDVYVSAELGLVWVISTQ